jgi:hypothetical protein
VDDDIADGEVDMFEASGEGEWFGGGKKLRLESRLVNKSIEESEMMGVMGLDKLFEQKSP